MGLNKPCPLLELELDGLVPVSNFPFNSRRENVLGGERNFRAGKCPGEYVQGECPTLTWPTAPDKQPAYLPYCEIVRVLSDHYYCHHLLPASWVGRLMSGPRLVGRIHVLDVHGRIVWVVSVFAFSATSATPSQRLALWVTGCWWRDRDKDGK